MNTEVLLNNFAIRCFRDTADQDYITARLTYRAALFPQFQWACLQALEKYLKTILLLNRIVAKDVGHSLERAFDHLKELPFSLDISSTARDFIQFIDSMGRFRYLEVSSHIYGLKLVELDRAVWEIRRYCTPLNTEISTQFGEKVNLLRVRLKKIQESKSYPPQKYRLEGCAYPQSPTTDR